MMERCYNPKHESYPDYGGRGIAVCEQWHSFSRYYEDTGDVPEEGLTLDRVNNDGNYEPDNVRWATIAEQSMNRRNTRYVEWDGAKKTLKQWASDLGISYEILRQRIDYLKWPIGKALTTPYSRSVLTKQQVVEIRYEHSANGFGSRRLAQQYGVSSGTIQAILEGRTWKHVL